MICDEQVTFSFPEYYMSSLLSVPEDPMRDVMEYHCSSVDSMVAFNGFSDCRNASTQHDAPVDVYTGTANMEMEAPFHFPEVQGEYICPIELAALPFNCPYENTGNRRPDTSMLNYLMPKEVVVSTEPYLNMECKHAESNTFPLHMVKMEEAHEALSYLNDGAYISNVSHRSLSKKNRQRSRAAEAENHRRTVITEKMQALQELLPASSKVKQGDHEVIVDKAVAHVKLLQLQLKELSRSRLGGESLSSLSFLEGYGHYLPQEQMIQEPLEEVIGSLIKDNEATALRLLESKGLHMMPTKYIDALSSPE